MSFLELKNKTARIPVTIFQIDLDKNDPDYEADFLDEPGCYDTPKTTNDIRAYKEGVIKTYSFASCHLFGLDTLPGLQTASSEPPKVSPSKDIGVRATASVSLLDFYSTDSFELTGNYKSRRVDASFWAKMFARNEFKYRSARILRGYVTDDFTFDVNNFQIEHYVIDEYQGPDLNGNVRFSLVDVLALTDGVNIKIPEVTSGILSADLNTTASTCTFNALNTSTEYGTTGYWVIGDEVMQYTITSSTSANIVRGRFGTVATEHKTNESIQRAISYIDLNVIDIMTDIFSRTKIPSSYIPTAKWDALKTGELNIYNFTALIYEPTEVKTLLNELVEHASLTMYTDVILQEITIVNNSLVTSLVYNFDLDTHIEKGSFVHENRFQDTITNQFIRWNLNNYLKTENSNYKNNKRVIDIFAEDASRLRIGTAGKDILSRWLANTVDNNQVASLIATRKVSAYSTIPKQIRFQVDIAHIGQVDLSNRFWLGNSFSVTFPKSCGVNPDGSQLSMIAQCTSIRPVSNNLWEITGLTYNPNLPSSYDFAIKSGTRYDYVLANDPEFAPILSAGGAREYVVLIEQGCLFGSTSTANAAFRQGTFPSGATLKLINFGQMLGKGGLGGEGASPEYNVDIMACELTEGFEGLPGGGALELTTNANIDNMYGLIAGGGKGGKGGTGRCAGPLPVPGGGGGGGQGLQGGAGGPKGVAITGSHTANDGYAGTKDAGGLGGEGETSAQNGFVGGELGNGYSVKTNGHTVSFLAGNNSTQVKGAII